MYVRVGLYFLAIILDIALIQRLPKLEKSTVLRPAVDGQQRKKWGKKVFMEDYNI